MTPAIKNEAVRRPLTLASPLENGDDVRMFKQAEKRLLKHWNLDHIKVDASHGYAGRNVFKAAALLAFAIGLSQKNIEQIKRGVISEHVQRMIRSAGTKHERRTKKHFARSRRRRNRIKKLRAAKVNRARKTVLAAGKYVGQTESPAGSNRGPGIISGCQVRIIGFDGVAWCGCFTGDLTRRVGRVSAISSRVAYTPYTVEDGGRKVNGFVAFVAPVNMELGDHVMYNFGSGGAKHTGLFLRHTVQNGVAGIVAREGNTSAGSAGSQDNGGGVFDRFRPYSDIIGGARPDWK